MLIAPRRLISAAIVSLVISLGLLGVLRWQIAEPDAVRIVVLAEDLRNGGILGVVMGVLEAAERFHWALDIFDVSSSWESRDDALLNSLGLSPDGVILVGTDLQTAATQQFLRDCQQRGIPVVGWHVGPYPGPLADGRVRVNISSDSLEVARAAAGLVQPTEEQPAGVVVFTDSRFSIALEKANRMVDALQDCERCTLLSVEDIPLDRTAELMPLVVKRLQDRFAERWTHALAINDLYFDHAVRELVNSPLAAPKNISAGDGSPSALLRIRHRSFQYASVAEPLLFHGWQLVDEIHRALLGEPPSGYVNPAYILTQENAQERLDSRGFFEPELAYREGYLHRWGLADGTL